MILLITVGSPSASFGFAFTVTSFTWWTWYYSDPADHYVPLYDSPLVKLLNTYLSLFTKSNKILFKMAKFEYKVRKNC